jgi:hypothetical protein
MIIFLRNFVTKPLNHGVVKETEKRRQNISPETADKIFHVNIHPILRQRIPTYATVALGICCCSGVHVLA